MAVNPVKAERDWPQVVVAGAYFTGIRLMRSLSRRGLTVCCIDCSRDNPGFRTVYGPAYECPNPDREPAAWLEFMVGLAGKLGGKPVLISSADQFVSAMASHASVLGEHYVLHAESLQTQALLATKERQYELAGQHGMPVPKTRMIQSAEELEEFAGSSKFPCLLKPLHFREWEGLEKEHPLKGKKLVIAKDEGELISSYRLAAGINPRLVAQEIIEGPDTAKYVYLSCYGRGGERLGSCVVRELRTCPLGYGSASIVEPVSEPEVETVCDRFLRSIGYVGICEIELKRDSRDGVLRMIEANPRYSGTSDAAPYAGVDIGWLHYLDLIGREVTPVEADGRTFRHICLLRDFAAIRSYRKAGLETWWSIVRSYRPPLAFYDFDPRDWRVSAKTLVGLARIVLGPTLRKFIPSKKPPASL